MRWQDLFADLEAQLRHAQQREQDVEVSDRTRRERAEIRWADRVAGSIGAELSVTTPVGTTRGRLDDLGKDWLLLADERGLGATLIPTSAVLTVSGATRLVDAEQGFGRRFGVGVALRAISRDRAAVEVFDLAGGQTSGTIDVVGADYLEVAEHPADLPRRSEAVTGRRLVVFSSLAAVRRR
ncbi:hypothetical protein [Demetria terragena]|uniref:hypothetical protein n=1 Tax=Demetria terragena TaxID=63959 RepID=UPI0003A10A90|nr:hypothetical protein [Demetria terragena]